MRLRESEPLEVWGDEMTKQPAGIHWLWLGLLARGNITLFTSMWKTGKTTLIANLLARRVSGGVLAGLAVQPGVTVVISEEPKDLWHLRQQRLGFGREVCLFCRPIPSRPEPEQWQALLNRIAELHAEHQVDLLIIDSLAMFLPLRNENHAGLMIDALDGLRELARRDIAVCLLHHPRKGAPPLGQAARGSGALQGYVDIIIEMHRLTNMPSDDRRRRLLSFSRHTETPGNLLVELNAAGNDYAILDSTAADDDFPLHWSRLHQILLLLDKPCTQQGILDNWPFDSEPPASKRLWRWLTRACRDGLAVRSGAGTKKEPFRYGLGEEGGE